MELEVTLSEDRKNKGPRKHARNAHTHQIPYQTLTHILDPFFYLSFFFLSFVPAQALRRIFALEDIQLVPTR